MTSNKPVLQVSIPTIPTSIPINGRFVTLVQHPSIEHTDGYVVFHEEGAAWQFKFNLVEKGQPEGVIDHLRAISDFITSLFNRYPSKIVFLKAALDEANIRYKCDPRNESRYVTYTHRLPTVGTRGTWSDEIEEKEERRRGR